MSATTSDGRVLLVATAVDAVLAEPPPAVHPVVWTGRLLARLQRHPSATVPQSAGRDRARGLLAWLTGASAVAAGARLAHAASAAVPGEATRLLVAGVLLKPTFALRMLLDEVAGVADALEAGDVPAARDAVSRLVSRDVGALDAEGIAMAAIETLAENLSDSLVAPLCWYAAGGLPGAALYRYANTADAVWGHPTPPWTHRGWAAARLDDLANLAPARLTAATILTVAGGTAPRLAALRREASRTASPNAGWPMAAMALVLDVRLAKVGHYVLHPNGRAAGPHDVRRALAIAGRAGVVAIAIAVLVCTDRRARACPGRGRPGRARRRS